jgi:hypothetical protein
LEKIFGGTTTLAAAKARLIRCTVPGIDSELFGNDTHTGSPGAARAYPNSLPPALFPCAPLSPSGLELRANSIGAFFGFHEAMPLTSSAERATGVT